MRAWLPQLRARRLTFWPRLVALTALRRFMQLLLPFFPLVPLGAEAAAFLSPLAPLSQLALTSCSNSFRICLRLKATMLWLGPWLSHTTASHSNTRAAFIP